MKPVLKHVFSLCFHYVADQPAPEHVRWNVLQIVRNKAIVP